jgi:hypothetical protein
MKHLGWNGALSKQAQEAFAVLEERSLSITDADLTEDDLSVIAYIDNLLKTKMKKSKGLQN